MDRLQEEAVSQVEAGIGRGLSNHELFHDLADLALGGCEDEAANATAPLNAVRTPRLTEAWFC
jgi:hypothetical protein